MRKKAGLLFQLLVVLLVVVGCGNKLEETKYSLEKGKVYQESITINGNVIPLGEGDWHLVSYEVNARGYIKARFFKLNGNVLDSRVTVVSKDASDRGNGYTESKAYLKPNIHYIEQISNFRGGEQECWLVNHVPDETFTSKSNIDNDTMKFIRSRSIQFPKTMIQAFHHFAGVDNYLNVKYYYNPELEGFEPDDATSDATSVWDQTQVHLDEDKVNYIESIKKKGSQLHALLKEGLAE
ncbi:MAG: hypothetical protein MJE63_13885 [Proteobacteria bacterium]|nr:hypothetical protein [Pseudomonadota bacterium]